jgi:hypothetical protein
VLEAVGAQAARSDGAAAATANGGGGADEAVRGSYDG